MNGNLRMNLKSSTSKRAVEAALKQGGGDEKGECDIDLADDRLVGVEAIAEFRGESLPRTRYLVRIGAIPVYREGRIICASKKVLMKQHLDAAKGQGEAA